MPEQRLKAYDHLLSGLSLLTTVLDRRSQFRGQTRKEGDLAVCRYFIGGVSTVTVVVRLQSRQQ